MFENSSLKKWIIPVGLCVTLITAYWLKFGSETLPVQKVDLSIDKPLEYLVILNEDTLFKGDRLKNPEKLKVIKKVISNAKNIIATDGGIRILGKFRDLVNPETKILHIGDFDSSNPDDTNGMFPQGVRTYDVSYCQDCGDFEKALTHV
jgi:hypothetical protein